jgi:uncharacterized protein
MPAPIHQPIEFPQVSWNLKDLILAVGVAAIGLVGLNLAIVALGMALNLPIRDNGPTLMIFAIAQDLIVVGAAWWFSIARYRVNWSMLGLRRFDVAFGCWTSVALLMFSYVVRIGYVVLVMAFGIQLKPQALLGRLDLQGWGFVLTLVVVAVLAPIAEEIFFRGFMYAGLRRRLGVGGAMVVSTLFFTTLHLSVDAFVPILVLGFCLAWLYEKTGSLYPGIFLHLSNNALALIALAAVQSTGIPLQ